jgi:hypothetical protein
MERHSMAWRVAIIAIPTLFVGAAFPIIASERAEQRANLAKAAKAQEAVARPSQTTQIKQVPPPRPAWASQSLALVDLNADGQLDLVGRIRQIQPKAEDRFAAFDGTDGTNLWTGEDLKFDPDSSPWPFVIAESTILLPESKTFLRAFSLSDGAEQWSIKLPEALGLTCQGADPGTAILQTEDKRWHTLNLADGALEPLAPALPPPCQPLEGDSAYLSRAGQLQIESPFEYSSMAPENQDGMQVRRAIYDGQSETMIAMAEKSPGTAIPILMGYQRDQIENRIVHGGLVGLRTEVSTEQRKELDREIARVAKKIPKSKAKILWSVPVPSSDPTEAQTGALSNRYLALQDGIVVAAYTGAAKAEYLTAFSAVDGTRLWEVPLAEGGAQMSRVVASPEHVYVVRSSGVEVFTLAEGKAEYILPPLPEAAPTP